MLARLRGLFARYADRHLTATKRGHSLPKVDGRMIGYLDSITVHGNRIRFDGWTTADQVLLAWDGGQAAQRPHIHRSDVADAFGVEPELGFAIDAPLDRGPYRATLRFGNAETACTFGAPSLGHMQLRRGLLWLQFLRDLAVSVPSILRWYQTHDPVYRSRVKARLNLDAIPMAGPMDPALFEPDEDGKPDLGRSAITIVLPVYNAFDLLPEALDRIEAHTDLPWHLVVIEDCSSDERVRPFLRDWCRGKSDRVSLLENDENLGFIGSVNKGLAKAIEAGRHVVLLNSDAFVPQDWASRLLRPFFVHDNVATVTPMSNDAEIFSVPAISTRTMLAPGEADRIDSVAQGFHPETALATAPTGVGFCMAMNIDALRELPSLDTVFGRGYGEEVDWCQKARQLGYRHLGLPGLFVEHRGGESFGSKEKRALIAKNSALIARRYPDYDREVQQFIQADPLVTPRAALAIAFIAARATGPVPVYVAHSLGGGAENYLQARISRELSEGLSSVILRIGGPQRFQMEIRTPGCETSGTTDDVDFLKNLLRPIARKRIIYSCGVGDRDPIELPDILISLCDREAGDEIEMLTHEFFAVSPSYSLLDHDHVYRGTVTAERTDPAHQTKRPDGTPVSIADWQAAWGKLVKAADRIIVFSDDGHLQIRTAYPEAESKLVVQPHSLLAEVPRLTAPDNGRTVVAVLGNIGLHKGAPLLRDLARAMERKADLSLVLIGNIDPQYGLPAGVPVHGNYHLEDLPELAAQYGVTCWLIPSICPETFSYTTHECLATGLPVFAFDIGAQGLAVSRAENGHAVAYDPAGDQVTTLLEALERVSGK